MSADILPGIIDQDKFQLWLSLQNGGQYYHKTIWPAHRFAKDGIEKVLTERVTYDTSGMIGRKSYMCKVYYTDIKVIKPQFQETPLTPLMAQRGKMNYAAKIMITLNFEAYQSGKLIQHTKHTIFLCDFLVPICSNMCSLINLKPTDDYNPKAHVKEVIGALKDNVGDIPEYEEGIYIINGNPAVLAITKDMAVNAPFIGIHEVLLANQRRIVAYCNVLCNAPKTTSVNISFAIRPHREKNIIFNWFIKSPPISKVKLPFLALFYMMGIFNEEAILENMMRNIKEEHQEECMTKLLLLIENSEMRDISGFVGFGAALFEVCSMDNHVVDTVANYVKSGLTPNIAMELFSMRFLPNIQGANTIENRINFICSIVARMMISYNNIEKMDNINQAREEINANRRSMQSARIDTAYEVSVLRFTNATYEHAYKPISNAILREIHAVEGDMSKLQKNMAEYLSKMIDSTAASKIMTSRDFKRTSIKSEVLSIDNYRLIDGKCGPFGRSMRCINMIMFPDYSESSSNLEMREPSHDSTCVICPHTTGEGNPGMNRSFCLSVILSFPETTIESIHNELLKRIIFCNHTLCTKIKFDGIIIGTICHIDKAYDIIRLLRREKQEMRFINLYHDEDMNEIVINYQAGHPFVPVLPVINHLIEELNGKRQARHISELALTEKVCKDVLAGMYTIEELIRDGIIEYISANEISFTYICGTIEEFIEQRDDPLKWFDYVFMANQHTSSHAMINFAMSMAPSQRNVYQLSQGRMIAEWKNAKLTVKKSSSTFDTQQMLGVNCSSVFNQASSRNVLTAYMPDAGADEEGSTFNAHAISRGLGMEYMTDKLYRVIKNDEKLLRRNDIGMSCPSYIDKDGFPKIGTVLVRGDPIIYTSGSQTGGSPTTEEYRQDLPAVVIGHTLMSYKGSRQIIEVYYSMELPLSYTAKISHPTGNKSIPSRLRSPRKLAKMKNGMTPTITLSVFMCRKRNINDHVINGNGWSFIESGRLPYYHPFQTPMPIETSSEFKQKMIQVMHSTFHLVNVTGELSKDPVNVAFVPTRRLEKDCLLEGYVTSKPKMNNSTNMPARGPKNSGGSMVDSEMGKTARHTIGTAGINSSLITDAVKMRICRHCGEYVTVHAKAGMMCQRCRSSDYDGVNMSYSMNVLKHRLGGSRIEIRMNTYTPGLTR